MHFGRASWSEHDLKMVLCRLYKWSNQGITMLSTYASRTIHVYWWLSDLLLHRKNIISALWGTWRIIMSGELVALLLSLSMTEWLRKWRRGWRYVCSNTNNAKSLVRMIKHLLSFEQPLFSRTRQSTEERGRQSSQISGILMIIQKETNIKL